ncbi:MAG: ZIP family metal transporter [Halobacteriaceae archaeon]
MALADWFVRTVGTDPVVQALVGGLLIAAMNLFGATLILLLTDPSDRLLDAVLGFAAGVMLAASFTSLILPGVDAAGGDPLPVLAGVVLGAAFLDRADALIPHAHYLLSGRRRRDAATPGESLPGSGDRLASVVLFILAITLHNVPEGLAVGVGFGSVGQNGATVGNAVALMLAIGIQNIPEGLAVSVAAVNAGLDRRFYAWVAGIRAGVVEVPVAVLGAFAVQAVAPLLPYAMGFAAGAMLYVISDEIVPETHARGHERVATIGTVLGTVVMLYLDVSLA